MNKIFFVVAFALFAGIAVQAFTPIRVSEIPKFRWDQFLGKVVLVTGGSSGIGFGTALAFARYGARVIICSRDSHPDWFNGSDAARRINEDKDVMSLGGYARWVKTDIADPEQVDALIQDIVDKEGTIDFAFNNAGIAGYLGPIFDEGVESALFTEHDTIRTNVFGPANCLAAELKLWAQQGRGGSIVNTASVDGLHGSDDGFLYCTSKHAVIGLTLSAALELKQADPPIRINALAPGYVDTSLVWQQCKLIDPDLQQQSWEGDYITHDHPLWKKYGHIFHESTPAGRITDPMDQARMVMYLFSEEAQYISASVMIVDGGINNEGIEEQQQ